MKAALSMEELDPPSTTHQSTEVLGMMGTLCKSVLSHNLWKSTGQPQRPTNMVHAVNLELKMKLNSSPALLPCDGELES